MTFTKKRIYYETAGALLREIREGRGWLLEEVAKKINISPKYIQAIEESNYSLLPPQPYVCGFLKKYAKFLNLDAQEIAARFKKESKLFQQDAFKAEHLLKQNDFSKFCTKRIPLFDFSKILIILAILIIVFYLVWNIQQSLAQPKIKIFSPSDNFVTRDSLIEIKGKVNSSEALMVDKIQEGYFSETINLSPGLNIIKISAKKRRGREGVVWRKIILEKE